MFRWQIWFAGPKTRWQGKPHASEIIASGECPWRWLARAEMLSRFRGLDQTKCGYALAQDDVVLEVYDPPFPETTVPA